MESYEPFVLSHLSPLVVVQGVGRLKEFPNEELKDSVKSKLFQNGEDVLFRKQDNLQDVHQIEDVFKVWRKFHMDGSVLWDSNSTLSQLPTHPHRYKFQFVDHQYKLPKQRNSEDPSLSDEVLPVGWIHKFKSVVPCLFVAFYELDPVSTDPLSLETSDQELIAEINTIKEQITRRNIKFLAIAVSRTGDSDSGLDDRISLIRKQTGLNIRNGLLLLKSTTPKALNQLALDLLQIAKPSSTEFYSQVEKRLRKERVRALSSLGETESVKPLIEVKFGLKLGLINELKQQYDNSIKSFESAYENLITIFSTQTTVRDPNWTHFRLLLDIAIFHIVKLYLYLEQPNVAYRKFDVHLQSVLFFTKAQEIDAASYDTCNWLAQQYKWLAQLSDLAPVNLVPSDYSFKKDSNRLTSKVLPHSGFLYLQSIDLLKRRESYPKDTKDSYSHGIMTEDYQETLLNLLAFAKLSFQKKDNVFSRSLSYINFQIAEENFKNGNYQRALRSYEQALDSLKEDDWGCLLGLVHFKLFQCSKELKKYYGSVLNLFELALISERELDNGIKQEIRNLTGKSSDFKAFLETQGEELVINSTADSSLDLFESEVLFHDEHVSLSKEASLQLKLSSKLNSVLDVTILDDVLISFKGSFPPILLKHSPTTKSSGEITILTLNYQEENDSFIVETNLSFSSYQSKVFHLTLPTKKIGTNTVTSINSTLTYNDYFKVKLDIPILSTPLKNRFIWFGGAKNKIVVSNDPASVEVVPRVPDTKVEFVDGPPNAYVGEKLALDFIIFNEDEDVVDLELEAEAEGNEYHFENDLKSLELKDLVKGKELKHTLFVEVPLYAKTLEIKLKITYFVGKDYEIPIKRTDKIHMLVGNPFKVNVHFHPRIGDNDLPSLFTPGEDESVAPKPSRYWLSKVTSHVDPDLGLEILEDELEAISGNEQISCDENHAELKVEVQDSKRHSSHFLETKILDGHSYRNVALDITSKIKWKRKGSDIINTYTNEPWKISLPLLDPRVLLDVQEKSAGEYKLTFLIENPTTRVFSFSTTLADNSYFETTGEKVQDLSVLPMTRHPIEYVATLNGDASGSNEKYVPLPVLKVYDVNYRVNLPTLAISELVQTHKGETFLRSVF